MPVLNDPFFCVLESFQFVFAPAVLTPLNLLFCPGVLYIWTKTFLATCHKTLFQEISHICRKDWEDPAHEAISRGNVHPNFGYLDNGAKKPLHTVVEELMTIHRTCIFSVIVELGNWKIAYENHCMIAGFSTCCLWDVPNGQINRPCTLISPKYRKLGFI